MTVLLPRIDWRSLDRAALGEAYNSAAAVANCSAITASWEPRSTPVRQRQGAMFDLAYGPAGRATGSISFEIVARRPRRRSFSCTGGYWQMRDERKLYFRRNRPADDRDRMLGSIELHACARGIHGRKSLPRLAAALDWLVAELPALDGRSGKSFCCLGGRRAPN